MRILQVCNVGNIVGGTAACAWSITRAMPEHEHAVIFRSRPTAETVREFSLGSRPGSVRVFHHPSTSLSEEECDLVILHNQHQDFIRTERPVLSFLHSHGSNRAPGDLTVYASQWLADLYRDPDGWVLRQGVPLAPEWEPRNEAEEIIVGRICTPQHRKWPPGTVQLYRALADEFPRVWWAFVGAPAGLRDPLDEACGGRTFFHPAEWGAQRYMHAWTAMLYHNPRLTESFGRTCAEAMQVGCFPLVDPKGGFLEQLPDAVPWRVQYPTAMSFISALQRLLHASAEQRWAWRSDMVELSRIYFSHTALRARLNDAIKETMHRHARKISGSACSTR